MQFCSECHNMYYLKIQDEDGNIGNTLIYYCRNCGHEDTTLSTNNICVSDMQLLSSEKKYTHIVNEYTKFDPTLPRINTIKCPNQECVSNGGVQGMQSMSGGGGKRKTEEEKQAAAESKQAAAEEKKLIKAAAASAKKSATKAKESAAQAQTNLAVAKANLETLIEEEEQKEQAEQQAEHKHKQSEHKHKQSEQHQAEQHNNREVIYIRYDDTNMKYVYLCAHCDTTWRTDNRI